MTLCHIGVIAAIVGTMSAARPSSAQTGTRERDRVAATQRMEGQAVLALADAAMAGRPAASDFQVRWQNDFLKAQRGTWVPFTLTIEAEKLPTRTVLVYVRAVAKPQGDARSKVRSDEGAYPVDAIFPVELGADAASSTRVSRGFSIDPGEYDVYVVVRERASPVASRARPKAAVLAKALSVPNFWDGGLTTSSIIVAEKLSVLNEPIGADDLAEHPYVIGQNDITPAADLTFRRDEELVVVFLVYNATVTSSKNFDIQVEYDFFRRGGRGAIGAAITTSHSPARPGERYFNHTDPQRFNPAIMGARFDPNDGHPVLAGQGVPLGGFESGDYRLAITVTDVLSGKFVTRDLVFSVESRH
jgi:hypothetical protein